MAELTSADVAIFTGGRLPDDADTQSLLEAALAAARRYCGWHVSPVRTGDELVVDGSGGAALSLPTRNLLDVTALVEDDYVWDVAKLRWSRTKGIVYKRGFAGCWTTAAGSIEVAITHGFTEAEAADWRRAVLRLANAMSYEAVVSRDDLALKRKKVDDVEYEWADSIISTDERLASMFSVFRILPSP